MIYDKSYLFSSAQASVWLHPFRLMERFLDRAVRRASVARKDELICALDCGNGGRNPLLASFCFPNGLRNGGKSIGCVVDHLSLSLTLPVILRGRLGLRVRDFPTSLYRISDGLLSRGDWNTITVEPFG
jgi:hypothetical protein